nr:hypothetical protein [Actinomycetes bacterium]
MDPTSVRTLVRATLLRRRSGACDITVIRRHNPDPRTEPLATVHTSAGAVCAAPRSSRRPRRHRSAIVSSTDRGTERVLQVCDGAGSAPQVAAASTALVPRPGAALQWREPALQDRGFENRVSVPSQRWFYNRVQLTGSALMGRHPLAEGSGDPPRLRHRAHAAGVPQGSSEGPSAPAQGDLGVDLASYYF